MRLMNYIYLFIWCKCSFIMGADAGNCLLNLIISYNLYVHYAILPHWKSQGSGDYPYIMKKKNTCWDTARMLIQQASY